MLQPIMAPLIQTVEESTSSTENEQFLLKGIDYSLVFFTA